MRYRYVLGMALLASTTTVQILRGDTATGGGVGADPAPCSPRC